MRISNLCGPQVIPVPRKPSPSFGQDAQPAPCNLFGMDLATAVLAHTVYVARLHRKDGTLIHFAAKEWRNVMVMAFASDATNYNPAV